MDCMPSIFHTSILSYEERFTVYWDLIFGSCKPREARVKLGDYVEKFVQKKGWKAIWSCPDAGGDKNDSLNVLVEIVDVISQNILAEVIVSKPLVTDSQMTLQEVQEMIEARDYMISLTELTPIYDDSGDFDETALALEHVRFFYENLWREWDEDNDGDYLYAARNLENRLRLHYDIAQKNLSKDFIRRYTASYKAYKLKVSELKKFRKDMAASDSEQELETSDVIKLAEKTHELENIIKSLQTMENPQMRYILASALKRPLEPDRNYSVTMIVAKQLTAKMCKTLPDETIIEHYTSLEKAVESYVKDDTMFIYSHGSYPLTSALVFKNSLTVTGVGRTIIECDEYDETSLSIESPEFEMNDIKFIQNASDSWLVVVEKGKTVLSNCEFHCVSNGIMVKRGAELVMRHCRIHGAVSAGLTIQENSVVHVEGCEISNNGSRDNAGGIKIIVSKTEPANVLIVENKIEGNFGYGINILSDHGTHNGELHTAEGVLLKLDRNTLKNNIEQIS